MFLIGLRRSGSVCLLLFTLTLFPLLRCPFVDFFGSLASRGFPSYLSLPSEGRDAFGRSRDAIGASRGFSSPSARLGPAGGVEELLVARSVHASSLLSPRFIRGLWDTGVALLRRTPANFYIWLALTSHLCTFDEVMGWESRSERFLAMFSVVSPASSLHARRGGEAGEVFECRSF